MKILKLLNKIKLCALNRRVHIMILKLRTVGNPKHYKVTMAYWLFQRLFEKT